MQKSLFSNQTELINLSEGLHLFQAHIQTAPLLFAIEAIQSKAAFRQMTVPRGGLMSVAVTNVGSFGWVSNDKGYGYSAIDPLSLQPWPTMPKPFSNLANSVSIAAGFGSFEPDACLINRYSAGAGMGLHQDKDEASFNHPIVSVSIGQSATFLWGGKKRSDPVTKIVLNDGDVLVWGGVARLNFHGVVPLSKRDAAALRYNLTLRRAR